MLNQFLHLWPAIKSAIEISKSIRNKNSIHFSANEIEFLKECHSIFEIFIKASTVLQGQKYCTIQYIYPYIFQVRTRLEKKIKSENLVSKILYLFKFIIDITQILMFNRT